MVKVLQLLGMTIATATSEEELSSLLQTLASASQSREQHILDAVARGEDTICVRAAAGDIAPIAGSFTGKMSQQAVQVAAGSTAQEVGSFCVPKQDVLLLQRTLGLNSARDFDVALATKKGEEKKDTVESTTGGKKSTKAGGVVQPAPTGYSQTGARCKVEGNQASNAIGKEVIVKTLDECKTLCDGAPGCVAFEFEPATKECELAKAVDLKASVADGVADGNDGRCNGDSCCYSKAQLAPSATPVKVLPLGDSITFGCGDGCDGLGCSDECGKSRPAHQAGWRAELWRKLSPGSPTSSEWDFVGAQQNGPDDIDKDHEGNPGWTIENIEAIKDHYVPLKPDVILLHIGTNNLGFIGLQKAPAALKHLESLLDTIFDGLPNVRLLLSTLIGAATSYGGKQHVPFNKGVRSFVSKYASAGRNIELVDMARECAIGEVGCKAEYCCMPLGVHPNSKGYPLMADVWYKHLANATLA